MEGLKLGYRKGDSVASMIKIDFCILVSYYCILQNVRSKC